MNIKLVLYDWQGYNLKLFHFFNKMLIDSKIYNSFLLILDFLFEINNLWIIFLIIVGSYLFVQNNDKFTKELKLEWRIMFSTLIISFIIAIVTAKLLKNMMLMPRPFCSLDIDTIRVLRDEVNKCYRSFPSGHATIATLIIASLWHIMKAPFKILAAILVLLVLISRVAMGLHYPVDVVAGCMLSLVTVYLIKKRISNIQKPSGSKVN